MASHADEILHLMIPILRVPLSKYLTPLIDKTEWFIKVCYAPLCELGIPARAVVHVPLRPCGDDFRATVQDNFPTNNADRHGDVDELDVV